MRMLNPPHPGAFVRTEVIESHGLTVAAAAQVLGVSRPALSTFLNGRSGLSGIMALRIEKAFGVKTRSCGCRRPTTSRAPGCAKGRSASSPKQMSKNGKRTSLSSRTETDYLLRSPRNTERLREAIARADAEEGEPVDVEELRRRLGLEDR